MQNIKIILTGSNGLLGQKLVSLFVTNHFDVFAFSRGKNRNLITNNYSYFNVNITNFNKVSTLIKKIKPHFIINAAAMTNVDACELRHRECDEINVNAVKNLVQVCKEINAHLLHISTDFIFDGTKNNYKENDCTNPVNYYGLSKLKSEKLIQKSTIDYTILRTILVYGVVANTTKGNIVSWVKNSLEAKKQIKVVTDQYRMPTLSDDLAQACLLAIQKRAIGIFHISSNELLNIYEIALQIATTFNLDKNLILPIRTEQLNQTATRPPKTGFNIDKAVHELGFKSASFKERLSVYKSQVK